MASEKKNRLTLGRILRVLSMIGSVRAGYLLTVFLFVDFSKAFDSIHRNKMQEMLPAYEVHESVSVIRTVYIKVES